MLKTLDLRYHELDQGYLAEMEREGLAAVLLTAEELEEAMKEPPEDSPALLRGRWIRDHRTARGPARVGWTRVQVGPRLQGRVIEFRRPDGR